MPRQRLTCACYYPQGDEATYESTKEHQVWNLVGLEGGCSVSIFQILTSLVLSSVIWSTFGGGGGNQAYIVGFQPLMVISPTASWIQWCMQVSGAPWNIPHDTCDKHGVLILQ